MKWEELPIFFPDFLSSVSSSLGVGMFTETTVWSSVQVGFGISVTSNCRQIGFTTGLVDEKGRGDKNLDFPAVFIVKRGRHGFLGKSDSKSGSNCVEATNFKHGDAPFFISNEASLCVQVLSTLRTECSYCFSLSWLLTDYTSIAELRVYEHRACREVRRNTDC